MWRIVIRRSDRGAAAAVLTVLITLVLAAAAGAGAYAAVHDHRQAAAAPAITGEALSGPTWAAAAPSPAPSAAAGAAPNPAAIGSAVRTALADPALGGPLLVDIADAASGTSMLSRTATAAGAPASTAKLLTAAAVLLTRGPQYRIGTQLRVVDSTAYLVGGGDPTLSAAAAGQASAYPDAARLANLAKAADGHGIRRVVVDDSAFTGPAVSPRWAADDVPSPYTSAITAVMTDGGRAAPDDTDRSATPDLAAGHELAALLGAPGATVARGTAPASAPLLAQVSSAPVTELITQMLQASDNVIAECLARQVAIATHTDPSFTGGAHAIRTVLTQAGVDPGAGLTDGSGLAASDRISPAALVAVLRLITGPAHPVLHAVVSALPVAGWSGTLADRYLTGSGSTAGAGVVRAKTGTLTGVATLAGVLRDADGRLLVFALMAEHVAPGDPATAAADAALDRIAAVLARCGCR